MFNRPSTINCSARLAARIAARIAASTAARIATRIGTRSSTMQHVIRRTVGAHLDPYTLHLRPFSGSSAPVDTRFGARRGPRPKPNTEKQNKHTGD